MMMRCENEQEKGAKKALIVNREHFFIHLNSLGRMKIKMKPFFCDTNDFVCEN